MQNLRLRGRPPPIIFALIVRPMNALQLCRWQFSHKKIFVADFLQAKCDFRLKTAVLHFWAPFGGLGATYDVRLMLIGKRVVDFLLVSTELFVRCYGWGATGENRSKIGDFAPTQCSLWPKISGRMGRPTNHFARIVGPYNFVADSFT